MGEKDTTLPYRTTGEDLERFVSAQARGRDLEQIRSLFSSSNAFRGTVSGAAELGFFDPEAKELTPSGTSFALGDSKKKKEALLEAVLAYEPYELLLEAVFGGGGVFDQDERQYTPVEWMESWWHTNNYGSSQTNISEGSTAFAKILEYVGLGNYKQGRHGHPSRVEWSDDADQRLKAARRSEQEDLSEASTDVPNRENINSETTGKKEERPKRVNSRPENNVLTLNLGNDRVAELSLPPRLTSQEKKRLVALVKLMIATDDKEAEVQMEMEF